MNLFPWIHLESSKSIKVQKSCQSTGRSTIIHSSFTATICQKSIPKHHGKSGFAMNCLFIYSPFLLLLFPSDDVEFLVVRLARQEANSAKENSLQYQAEQEISERWWNGVYVSIAAHTKSFSPAAFTSDASQMRWYFSLNLPACDAMAKWKSSVFLHSPGSKVKKFSSLVFLFLVRGENKEVVGPTSGPGFSAETIYPWWVMVRRRPFSRNWLDHILAFFFPSTRFPLGPWGSETQSMQHRVRNFQTFLTARSPMRISINYDDTVRERGKHLCRFRWHRNARIRRFGVYAASIRNVNIYATTQLSVWSEKRLFTLSYALHRSAARFRFRHERSVCARPFRHSPLNFLTCQHSSRFATKTHKKLLIARWFLVELEKLVFPCDLID